MATTASLDDQLDLELAEVDKGASRILDLQRATGAVLIQDKQHRDALDTALDDVHGGLKRAEPKFRNLISNKAGRKQWLVLAILALLNLGMLVLLACT